MCTTGPGPKPRNWKRQVPWSVKPPAEVARNSDVIFTIVGFPVDVEEVYFGKDGILDAAAAGSVVVDMTTSEPSLAKRIYDAASGKGIAALDAPRFRRGYRRTRRHSRHHGGRRKKRTLTKYCRFSNAWGKISS